MNKREAMVVLLGLATIVSRLRADNDGVGQAVQRLDKLLTGRKTAINAHKGRQ